MKIRRNIAWTDEDHAILKRMLAAGEGMPAIGRVLHRSQIDVAARAFAANQSALRND